MAIFPCVVVVATAGLLAGCLPAEPAPALLRHTQTGELVQCGPYDTTAQHPFASAMLERKCIEDLQRKGYERVEP